MKLHAEIVNLGPLTQREGDVLIRLGIGKTREQIAADLHRSSHTISRHVEHIGEKLHAHNHAEIIASAVAHQLIEITLRCWLLFAVCLANLTDLGVDMRRAPSTPRQQQTRLVGRSQAPRVHQEV